MFGRLFALVLGALSGLTLAQFPEFAQQYEQRLGGRIDELRDFVAGFDHDAARAGLSRAQALAEFTKPDSKFLQYRGEQAAAAIQRFEAMSDAKARLDAAAPFERLLVFTRVADSDIARAALHDFEPAVPASLEGVAHAGVGFVIGALLSTLFVRLSRRRPRGGAAPPPPDLREA